MTHTSKVLLTCIALAVGAGNTALAKGPSTAASKPSATLPKGVTHVTSVEGIEEYRLENGLRVLFFHDPSKQTAVVNITYLVGSRHENYGETGMAHLLEHLVFKGTPNHPNIPDELTSHGTRPNGSTWYDRTNYFETFSATEENLDWALELEADRMVNSYIKKEHLDSEMTVVRNELERGENSPSGILMERILSTAFLWHNYGKDTIGARADLESVPIDRLQAFYRTWYQPDNAVLVIAGKFESTRTLGKVAEYFGRIPKPARKLPTTYTLDPTQDGERMVTLRRVGDTQVVSAAYHIPSGAHADYAAIEMLEYVLGDVPSGRLHKGIVETKKASSAGAFAFQLKEPGILYATAEVRKESPIEPAQTALFSIIEQEIQKNPATKEEVERAKLDYEKGFELAMSNPERVGVSLSEWAAMGDWRLMFLHRDRVKKVTPADVNRVAAAYLKSSNRTAGVFVPTEKPDRAEIPLAPDVDSIVKDYKGGEPIAQGEVFDPTPENIEKRTVRTAMKGGVKAAFLEKETRADIVNLSLNFRFGDVNSLKNRGTAGDLAGMMLMRGTKKKSRQDIYDAMDKLKATVAVSAGPTSATANILCKRAQLPEAMALAAEMLKEPGFDAKEFEILKQELLAAYEESRNEPGTKASTAYTRHLYPYPKEDPRYASTADEDIAEIKRVTLDEVKAFHKDFYGASNGELAVVGDHAAKDVQKLYEKHFGGWKSPKAFARLVPVWTDAGTKNENIEAPDKANAELRLGQRVQIRDDDADYPGLVLGMFMTGGGFLNSRLAVRVRQKDGLSYGVGGGFSASALDKEASFSGYAIFAPQNRDKVEKAMLEELQKVVDSGFTEDEVKQAKSGWLQSRVVGRAQDGSLARSLGSYLFIDRTFAWDADLEKKVMALTPAQIQSALKKHMDPKKISVFKSGDFAKPAPAAPAKGGGGSSGGSAN